jgi:transposase
MAHRKKTIYSYDIIVVEVIGVIKKMDKYSIITLKKNGLSFREISRKLNIHRKTVAKIWNEYMTSEELLINSSSDTVEEITDQIIGNMKYDTKNRKKIKMTDELKSRIHELMESEKEKSDLLGLRHKQSLSSVQIHGILQEEGFDIGRSSVSNYVREIKQARETYIRQEYRYGDRLEYDFGEVKLVINGKRGTYYLAVFAAPASGYRYAYLYKNQKKEVFLDSHVRFFEKMRGSWREVVYDNMRNVVSRFISFNKKEYNEDCINLALYYGYEINTTNVRSGNEKGSVEESVKVIRNRVFAKRYKFQSYEEAREYLQSELEQINKEIDIKGEQQELQAYRPPLEIAQVEKSYVDKYSCIRIANNYYSIPDILINKYVTVKLYHDRILIYSNQEFVCEHKRIEGQGQYQLHLNHYLKTLKKKPGALRNSLVLQQQPALLEIFQKYYKSRARDFIEILQSNTDKEVEKVIEILKYQSKQPETNFTDRSDSIQDRSRKQLQKINKLMN